MVNRSLRMIRKLEAAKNPFHLLIAAIHPDRELRHPHVHFGEPDFHMGHTRFEIADARSDLTDVRLQVGDIRLNAPEDLENELVCWFGHSQP
jgi:hypothetical protein